MKKYNILEHFKGISVDDPKNKVPESITHVPTLIVADMPRPLVANEAFKWLENVIYINQQKQVKANQEENKEMQKKSPHPFINSEMSGISDSFAYTNVDVPQPKSFMGYKDDEKNIIYTAEEADKLNITQQRKLLNQLNNERQSQDKHLGEIIEYNKKKVLETLDSNTKNKRR
jgi:hypothetical protein